MFILDHNFWNRKC